MVLACTRILDTRSYVVTIEINWVYGLAKRGCVTFFEKKNVYYKIVDIYNKL